jgi:hypothetical protein
MIRSLLCAGLFLDAVFAIGAPPVLDLPAEVRPVNGYARLTPKTDAVSIRYVALDGVYAFPPEELKDGRRFVLPAAGLKDGRYRFVAVAAGKTGEQAEAEFVVVVGKVAPDDGKKKDDDKKAEPPIPPAPVVMGTVWLVVVEETSQRTPELAAVLGDLAYWQGLRTKDVMFRFYDKDSTDPALKSHLPDALTVGLPALLTMDRTGKIYDARKLAGKSDVDAALKEVGR